MTEVTRPIWLLDPIASPSSNSSRLKETSIHVQQNIVNLSSRLPTPTFSNSSREMPPLPSVSILAKASLPALEVELMMT